MDQQAILNGTLATIALGLMSSGAVMLGNKDIFGLVLVAASIVVIFTREHLKQ